ncbi:hypothetical protein [Agrococcus sp. SCSIO52902]|uniref:PH-like domain-containing protein n=1 Tax=Agrococcus sp. SCSIO52902 TaxID=2933290 RepID=UPI001FF2DF2F|nr:hypothetical protein [Agrococcus sp. SCSIO52902]UOW00518.1 hypothetical protein MU522_11420 [Agrococcus sp. SCSIO52902]
MTKELFALLSAAFVAVLAIAAVLGVLAHRRRQRDIEAPAGWIDVAPQLVVDALYVATTRAGEPYQRIFAHGLGFRGRTRLAIDATGVQLLADRTEMRIPAGRIRAVERATWTIDRVVEPGGIIVIAHSLGADVDTYLRVIGDDSAAFAALHALAAKASPATPTASRTQQTQSTQQATGEGATP